MRLVREVPGKPDPERLRAWAPVVTHTHNMRGGKLNLEQTKKKLVARTRELGIRAVGVGSPWEPVSAASYMRYEGKDRDLYYSGTFDQKSVMDHETIQRVFDDLNAMAGESTLFYQDNETPKGRMTHMWWFGYNYDYPAWHDYSQDRPIQRFENDPEREINAISGKPHRRRSLFEILAVQRRAGAIGVFAHPTSWWLTGEKFTTNIASQCALFLLADGYLDGFTVMGYNACHRSYQALWFHLLDTGAIVPGFAETDGGLNRENVFRDGKVFLNYLHIQGKVDLPSIVKAAREGACFASSGAFLTTSVDGVPMGKVCRTESGRAHRLKIEAYPVKGQTHFSRLDVIGRGGKVLAVKEGFGGGVLEYEFPGRDEAHYVVVRAFGQHDDPDAERYQSIEHLVISNPVYLHPEGFRFAPAQTACTIRVEPGSLWIGGELTFEDAGGETIERHPIKAGDVRATLPASARVHLRKGGMEDRRFYIAMENPEVQRHLRYLYYGKFRRDFPKAVGGEVPAEAYRLEPLREALQQFIYTLR